MFGGGGLQNLNRGTKCVSITETLGGVFCFTKCYRVDFYITTKIGYPAVKTIALRVVQR